MAQYSLQFKGQLKQGADKGKVTASLLRTLKLNDESLLYSGKAFTLRSGADKAQLLAFKAKLEKHGIVTRLLEPESLETNPDSATKSPAKVKSKPKDQDEPSTAPASLEFKDLPATDMNPVDQAELQPGKVARSNDTSRLPLFLSLLLNLLLLGYIGYRHIMPESNISISELLQEEMSSISEMFAEESQESADLTRNPLPEDQPAIPPKQDPRLDNAQLRQLSEENPLFAKYFEVIHNNSDGNWRLEDNFNINNNSRILYFTASMTESMAQRWMMNLSNAVFESAYQEHWQNREIFGSHPDDEWQNHGCAVQDGELLATSDSPIFSTLQCDDPLAATMDFYQAILSDDKVAGLTELNASIEFEFDVGKNNDVAIRRVNCVGCDKQGKELMFYILTGESKP